MNDTGESAHKIPATSVLSKFECVGRLGSVTAAARELGTSPASLSRGMKSLERQLSARLLERHGNGVRLTEAGRRYHEGVTAALGRLHASAAAAMQLSQDASVVIACSLDDSHLLVMPSFSDLERIPDERARIRLLTYHRSVGELGPGDIVDILLSWQALKTVQAHQTVFIREAVRPICSPAYLAAHERILQGPSTGWGGVKLLEMRPNRGWASWENWFNTVGHPGNEPRVESYDTYTQVLAAAAAGRGVALGWKHYCDGHLDTGAVVALSDGFVPFGGRCVAELTNTGQRNPSARRCLEFFELYA